MSEPYIYIVLSRTDNGTKEAVELVTGLQYNHASVAFDRELHEMYSFMRSGALPIGRPRLIREVADTMRYNGRVRNVPLRVYAVPVTDSQRETLKTVLLTLATTDIHTVKSPDMQAVQEGMDGFNLQDCLGFATWCLQYTSVDLQMPAEEYDSEGLFRELEDYCCYVGLLSKYSPFSCVGVTNAKNLAPALGGAGLFVAGAVAVKALQGVLRKK